MDKSRFQAITQRYSKLKLAIVGDFCLDRYLEIDPARRETSIETGLPVHNVVRVRSQPGAAGTILNNLVALGLKSVYVVGFAGPDGEGFELQQALASMPGVNTDFFLSTRERQTFTYTKPLVIRAGKPPEELNRLDRKNWTPTPKRLQQQVAAAVEELRRKVDGIILMDQVDIPETGVVTRTVLKTVEAVAKKQPDLLIIADSRRGLGGYPPVCLKMNRAELSRLCGQRRELTVEQTAGKLAELARAKGRTCFVTMAERGMVGASPDGTVERVSSLPLRGEIDIVGAGDSVTANLTSAMAAGASLREALELANAAASVVIHKLGTTGTASVREIKPLLFG